MAKSIRIAILTCGAVGLGVFTAGLIRGQPAETPSVQWYVKDGRMDPLAEVAPETTVRCGIKLPRPAWVYAAEFDPTRGALALFPSQQLRTDLADNPLQKGPHQVPGQNVERVLSWHSGDAHGPVSFLLLVSDSPLPELEEAMTSWRQVGNAAFPSRPVLGTYAPQGGMEVVPPRSELPSAIMRAAHEMQRLEHDGQMALLSDGVYASVLRLQVRAPAPNTESENAGEHLRRKIEAKIGEMRPAKQHK